MTGHAQEAHILKQRNKAGPFPLNLNVSAHHGMACVMQALSWPYSTAVRWMYLGKRVNDRTLSNLCLANAQAESA